MIGSEPASQPIEDAAIQGIISKFSSLSRDLLIYGIGGVLVQLTGIVLLPILTRQLSAKDYGTLDLIYTSINYITLLLSLNLIIGITRYYYDAEQSQADGLKRLISTGFWATLGLSIPLATLFVIGAGKLSQWIFNSSEPILAFRLAILAVPLQLLFNLMVAVQRFKRKPVRFIVLNLVNALLNFSVTFIFVVLLHTGLSGVFIGQIVAYGFAGALATWFSRDLVYWQFSFDWLRRALRYSLPQLPASMLHWWLAAVNRYFVNAYVGLTAVGFYGVAGKVAMVMLVFVQAFVNAWMPFMLENMRKPDAPRVFSIALKYYLIFTLAMAGILACLARELFAFFAPASYLPGAGLVALLVVRYILDGTSSIIGVGLVLKEKTIFISLSLAIGALANIVSNLLLTPRYGIYGAAFSEVVGYLLGIVCWAVFANQQFPVPWKYNAIVWPGVLFIGTYLGANALIYSDLSWGWSFLARLVLLGIYLIIFLGMMDASIRRKLFIDLPGRIFRSAWPLKKQA